MRKTDHCRSTERKPLADMSRDGTPSRTGKKITPEDKDDGTIDRLLLAHTNLSKLISQIDELVVRAFKNKMTIDMGAQEIDSFIHVLSEMHSSLKAWALRFQQTAGLLLTEPREQLGQALVNKTVSAANGVRNSVSNGPNECEQDLIVSPSPLVSWRGGAYTVENGRQLFLLTPVPKPKLGSSKCPGASKTIVAKFPKNNTSCSTPKLLPSQTAPTASLVDPLETVEVKPTPMEVGKSNFNRKDHSMYLLTPRLMTSSSKMCPLLDLIPESFQQVDRNIQLSSHWVARTENNDRSQGFINSSSDEVSKSLASRYPELSGRVIATGKKEVKILQSTRWDELHVSDDSSNDEVSKSLASRYPELFAQQPRHKPTTRRKEVDDTLDWFLSPPKTCVLLEPPTEKLLQVSGRVMGFCDDDVISRLTLTGPDHTPVWRELGSRLQNGKKPGETTLKRELWTRFEAVSADGLQFDATAFKPTARKGFIDMLEEASCEAEDSLVT